jgi:hypothetical protein
MKIFLTYLDNSLKILLGVSVFDFLTFGFVGFLDFVGEDFKWIPIILAVILFSFNVINKFLNYNHTKEINKIKKDTEKEKLYREVRKTDVEIINKELNE